MRRSNGQNLTFCLRNSENVVGHSRRHPLGPLPKVPPETQAHGPQKPPTALLAGTATRLINLLTDHA